MRLPPEWSESFLHELFPSFMGNNNLDDVFYEWVTQQTNKYACYCQKDCCDSKWEGINAKEIQAYVV